MPAEREPTSTWTPGLEYTKFLVRIRERIHYFSMTNDASQWLKQLRTLFDEVGGRLKKPPTEGEIKKMIDSIHKKLGLIPTHIKFYNGSASYDGMNRLIQAQLGMAQEDYNEVINDLHELQHDLFKSMFKNGIDLPLSDDFDPARAVGRM